MNGISYLIACLAECNDSTTLSFGVYNTLYRGHDETSDTLTIHTSDNGHIRFSKDDTEVYSEYDEKFNILEITY